MDEEHNQTAPQPSAAGDDTNTAPLSDLEQCEKERDEYLSGWQRMRADFLNYKKDEALRMQEMARYSAGELITEILKVMDSFDLAIAAMEKDGKVEKGIYMIRAQIEDMVKRYGVKKVPIAPGDSYDPATAEAIIEVESDISEGDIVEEVEAGYFLHDKLLRPARVKISKGRSHTNT